MMRDPSRPRYFDCPQRTIAGAAEAAEAEAWLDLCEAAPPGVVRALDIASLGHRGLAMVRSRSPLIVVNQVLMLGTPADSDDRAFETIERFYAEGRCGRHGVVVCRCCEPAELGPRLRANGYRSFGARHRMLSMTPREVLWSFAAEGVNVVDGVDRAREWSALVRRSTGLPALFEPWLLALAERPRWIHAFRRGGKPGDGQPRSACSVFLASGGWAWLGIRARGDSGVDDCAEDDVALSAYLFLQSARRGATHFCTDIGQWSRRGRAPDASALRSLGLQCAYARELFVR